MFAFAHATLDEKTIKWTGFLSGDKQLAFIRGFYGLKGLPNFFTHQKCLFFRNLITEGNALVYFGVILRMSNSKPHTLQLIEHLHDIANWGSLELVSEKSFFSFLFVKNLGHDIGFNTSKLIQSKIAVILKFFYPTTKTDLMKFLGSKKMIDKFHVNLKLLFYLLQDNTKIH